MTQEQKLKVLVVGAGLGGCAAAMAMHHAGFEVIIVEKIRQFQRLGDSLGLGENALRLLERWGCTEKIKKIGNKSPVMHIRRYDTGEIIATQRLMDMAGYIGHRGDYHQAFIDRVGELGIEIRMGSEIVSFDESVPQATLKSGEVIKADVILGADGIKSPCRELVLGFYDAPKSSGYACFRAYTEGVRMKDDPDTSMLVAHDTMNVWIGPDMHVVQNTTHDGASINWIASHKADRDLKESWSAPGKIEDAVALVKGWDPVICKVIEKTPSCLDWLIVYRDPLPTWISKTGNVALMGDAAHPHLPTSAQGASQACEDAAVLAVCLQMAGKDRIRLATLTYERLRYARVLKTQKTGEALREKWHNALKKVTAGEWIDPRSIRMENAWVYQLDVEQDAKDRYPAVSAQIQKEMDEGNVALPGSLLGDDRYDIPSIPEEELVKIEEFVKEAQAKYSASLTGRAAEYFKPASRPPVAVQ